MRGRLPLLALTLTLTLAAGALPAAADSTAVPDIAQAGKSNAASDEDKIQDGSTLQPPADVTDAGVTVVRGGNAKPPTVEEAADGVTVIRGYRTPR